MTIATAGLAAGLAPLPPDPILGLAEAYAADPRPSKISLASGVYVDESGITPVLATVAEAERRILEAQTTKLYKPIAGDPAYLRPVRDLVFGAGDAAVAARRVETLHTPGGTGALRVAADLIARIRPEAAVWLSTPTWPNHPQVFAAAGLATGSYPYRGADGRLAAEAMLDALAAVPSGDVVVLHACCHNPTGVDPDPEIWRAIADVLGERGVLPLLDFAYQGFGDGLVEDAVGLHAIVERVPEALVASSFSKNFALYDERVGALSIVAATPADAGDPAEPRQGRGPGELLEPAGPWRRDRRDRPRRPGTPGGMDRRGRDDARPDPRQPAGIRRGSRGSGRAGGLVGPPRPARDVLAPRARGRPGDRAPRGSRGLCRRSRSGQRGRADIRRTSGPPALRSRRCCEAEGASPGTRPGLGSAFSAKQDPEVGLPGSDCRVAGRREGRVRLGDVIEVVDGPGREELPKGHLAELRMAGRW